MAACTPHQLWPAPPAHPRPLQDIPTLVSLPRPLPPGIPDEQSYIRAYCAARGLPYPLQARRGVAQGVASCAPVTSGVGYLLKRPAGLRRCAQRCNDADMHVAPQLSQATALPCLPCTPWLQVCVPPEPPRRLGPRRPTGPSTWPCPSSGLRPSWQEWGRAPRRATPPHALRRRCRSGRGGGRGRLHWPPGAAAPRLLCGAALLVQ